MMKNLVILVAALSLAACATVPAPSTVQIDRVEARYEDVRAFATLLLPYLPAEKVARIQLAGRVADKALLAVRTATTIREQRVALVRAEAAISNVNAVVDRP